MNNCILEEGKPSSFSILQNFLFSLTLRQIMIDDILYYYIEGGEKMNYKRMLQLVAKEYHTTPEDVEKEIKNAIKIAGYDIEPQLFIALCAIKAMDDIS